MTALSLASLATSLCHNLLRITPICTDSYLQKLPTVHTALTVIRITSLQGTLIQYALLQ